MNEHDHEAKDEQAVPPTQDEVAKQAYAIYTKEGKPQGHAEQNWLEAEAKLKSGDHMHMDEHGQDHHGHYHHAHTAISRRAWDHCGGCSSGNDKEPAGGEQSGKDKPLEFAGSRSVASR